jgi:fumarylacetoacetase
VHRLPQHPGRRPNPRGLILGSWVPGADGSGFGIEHLPYGVVRRPEGPPRPAVRIGEHALELALLAEAGLLAAAEREMETGGSGAGTAAPGGTLAGALTQPSLNGLLELGTGAWSALRARLVELLDAEHPELRDSELAGDALVPLSEVEMVLPVEVGDYVDFYSSLEHASNVGRLVRPEGDPLFPNWRHLPVGYHGRSGTVVVSGTPIPRPAGQLPPEAPDAPPGFGPEPRLDFELELGFLTGPGPAAGEPIPAAAAAEHIFGFCLVNDWSARSIQVWEYQPLGPFLGKSFATSIAPWITPLEALEPFRVPGPEQEPASLDYLRTAEPWALDLELEVALAPRGTGGGDGGEGAGEVISRTNARGLYWSCAQQLAHATVNGATARAGDLFASGTISGPEPGTQGCLLELTRAGTEPLTLADGSERAFLEDGDEVILRGAGAPGDGRPPLTLAEARGRIEPAR